jgi:hypothetical protein
VGVSRLAVEHAERVELGGEVLDPSGLARGGQLGLLLRDLVVEGGRRSGGGRRLGGGRRALYRNRRGEQ